MNKDHERNIQKEYFALELCFQMSIFTLQFPFITGNFKLVFTLYS